MAKAILKRGASKTVRDPRTGVPVRQVTFALAIHHHPFFLAPAFDDAMRYLLIVSHEAGAPQVFAERQVDGAILQLTDRPDLDEWSLFPGHRDGAVYYTAGGAAYRLNLVSSEESKLFRFPQWTPRPLGGVAGDMGTTALSADDRWWAVHFERAGGKGVAVVDAHAKQGWLGTRMLSSGQHPCSELVRIRERATAFSQALSTYTAATKMGSATVVLVNHHQRSESQHA